MIDVLHHAVVAFNAFVIVYMLAVYANQLVLVCCGWREISEYVKRRSLRDYATIAESELSVPVSILTPAYNEEGVILESIRSLLRSHYAGFEVIVVNDGSSDRTLEVVSEEYKLVEDRRVWTWTHSRGSCASSRSGARPLGSAASSGSPTAPQWRRGTSRRRALRASCS